MKVRAIFMKWHFGQYTIVSPDKTCKLWVANGFAFFEDHEGTCRFLTGLSFWNRWKLWREYKKEKERRRLKGIYDKPIYSALSTPESEVDSLLRKMNIKVK